MPKKKQTAADILMNELLLCGGEWIPRHKLFADLLAEGMPRKYAEWYMFCLGERQPELVRLHWARVQVLNTIHFHTTCAILAGLRARIRSLKEQ